jgi:hypothetical protein
LLEDSGWELRGARWSHAFLCLEAAHQLAQQASDEVAQPAVASALAFLDGSQPTRERPLDPELAPARGFDFEGSVRRDDLPAAEAALIALSDRSELERRWFDLALSNLEGWGHRPLMALATWRLGLQLEAPRGWLLRAGLRHWLPWEEERGLDLALGSQPAGGGAGAGEAMVASAEQVSAEGIGTAILEGQGPTAVAAALSQGADVAAIGDGILRAACRSFAALPELRQLHGVTLARAVVTAVTNHGASPTPALPSLAHFVAEGWAAARRSGRIIAGAEHPELGSPGSPAEPEIAVQLCRREATPNFGHLIKLVEASSALPSLMAQGQGDQWAGEILRAAQRKATPYRRVWATVRRHMDLRPESF